MTDLRTKIFQQKIHEKDADTIKQFKADHRKSYLKTKAKEYAAKQKRKTLIFPIDEYGFLQKQAKTFGIKMSPFLKGCITAYLGQTYILPSDGLIKNIEQSIRDLSNRLNEVLRYLHSSKDVAKQDIQILKTAIFNIEKLVSDALRKPPTIEKWLIDQQKKSVDFLPKLLKTVSELLTLKK